MAGDGAASTPEAYIEGLQEPRRSEIRQLHELVREHAPRLEPYVRDGLIAYGRYRYRYATGREGEWYPIGLAARKQYISLYVTAATPEHGYLAEAYRSRLPKADIGRASVRIKHVSDVDLDVVAALVQEAATDHDTTLGPTDGSAGT